MATTTEDVRVWMGWRKDGKVQHVAVRGRGKNKGKHATACNTRWIRRDVLKDWVFDLVPHPDRRPCILCQVRYVREGASWRVMLDWLRAQAAAIKLATPKEERL